ATDQRGVTRPRNGDSAGSSAPDIGAYERFNGKLKITKSADRSEAGNGATITYTIVVTNEHASEPASEVLVTDELPPNVIFQSVSNTSFTYVDHEDGIITARRATLAPGASATATITCAVEPFNMVNNVAVSQLGFETSPGDNVDTAG